MCGRRWPSFAACFAGGGALLIAVHAGEGAQHFSDYKGIAVDITLHYRTPDAFAALVRRAGFTLQVLRGAAALPLRARDRPAVRRRARRLSERSHSARARALEVALGLERGHAAGAGGGDRLAIGEVGHVARGEDAGHDGLRACRGSTLM